MAGEGSTKGAPTMPASRGLSRDTKLSVLLDAICSRNRYTTDPGPVLVELYAAASDRTDVLIESAGTWVGCFEDDNIGILCAALRQELPGLEPWIELGQWRRHHLGHRTPRSYRSESESGRIADAVTGGSSGRSFVGPTDARRLLRPR